ncbi:MAG: hypothetical protein OXC53_04935 [Rhodobacteraceae bacterium]|nr:hypothetical protein [Paracoccaceae bacterium]
MTRSPWIPTLALLSTLLLAACGGGGGGGTPDDERNPPMKTCSDGSRVLQSATCPVVDTGRGDNEAGSSDDDAAETGTTTGGGTVGTTTSGGGGEETTDTTPTTDRSTTTAVTLSSLCTPTLCRGVFWSGTARMLDPGAVPSPMMYDPDGPPRDPEEFYDHDNDPMTPQVNRGSVHEPRLVTRYEFQPDYDIPAADPPTTDTNAREEAEIALAEQDARYAQATVEALANVIALIRTGREKDDLDLSNNEGAQWFAGAEIADFLDQKKSGGPLSAFSATRPLTSINPVAQIIAARGVSHDLRGAADEDFDTIAFLLGELAKYKAKAMEAKVAIDERKRVADALATRLAPTRSQVRSTRERITTEETALNALRAELRVLLNYPGGLESLTDSMSPTGSSCVGQTVCEARRNALQGDTGLIETKNGLLVSLRTTLAGLNRRLTEAGVNANDQMINRLNTSQAEIQYYLDLIAAAESAVTAQQTADKAALDDLPNDIESTKATAIRTALEGIINATGATDPATARFAGDGDLADLTTAGTAVFARNPTAESDSPPPIYADYGMWLTGTDAAPVLETRMGLVDPDGNAPGSGDLTTPGSATYNGTAHGLSARTSSGENPVSASGHFTAAVTLNATFGDAPMIGGTVTNFQQPVRDQGSAHVSSAWTINLRPTAPRSGEIRNAPFKPGTGTGHPTSGGWSAYPYGAAGAPPIGIYGGFAADFTDGAAIGQFDARP